MVEELTEQDARDQIETNLLGVLWITQAAIPLLREQGAGHIIQVSSIGGSAFPNIGMYYASKRALAGHTQSLAQEVAEFGIHVTRGEPAGSSTDWSGSSARHTEQLRTYDLFRVEVAQAWAARQASPGDPVARWPRVARATRWSTPRNHRDGSSSAMARSASRRKTTRVASLWREWEPLSVEAHGHRS